MFKVSNKYLLSKIYKYADVRVSILKLIVFFYLGNVSIQNSFLQAGVGGHAFRGRVKMPFCDLPRLMSRHRPNLCTQPQCCHLCPLVFEDCVY